MRLERRFHILDLALGDQTVLDQAFGVELKRGFVPLDACVHHAGW